MASKSTSELHELVQALHGLNDDMRAAPENFISVIEKSSESLVQPELLDPFVKLLDALASADLARIEQATNELAKSVDRLRNKSSTQ